MSFLNRLARGIDALNERLGRVVSWLLLAMVLIGALNAVLRYSGRSLGLDLSSNAGIELQWYLFGIVFLVGGAYTLKHGAHVRVDVLYDRLSVRVRAWIDLVGHLLILLPFCGVMLWISWDPVWDSIQRGEKSPDPSGLPRYLIKPVIPIAFILLGLQAVAQIIKLVATLRGVEPEPLEPDLSGTGLPGTRLPRTRPEDGEAHL